MAYVKKGNIYSHLYYINFFLRLSRTSNDPCLVNCEFLFLVTIHENKYLLTIISKTKAFQPMTHIVFRAPLFN